VTLSSLDLKIYLMIKIMGQYLEAEPSRLPPKDSKCLLP